MSRYNSVLRSMKCKLRRSMKFHPSLSLCAVLLATPVLAEPVRSISLADAIALSVQNNPDFRSTGYDVRAAQGAVAQASVLPNPSILLAANGRGTSPLVGPVPNQFGINFTVHIGGKISAARSEERRVGKEC